MPETPYSAKILELTAKLAGLNDTPMPAMFSEDELEKRRQKQARDEQLAVLAKLSGDKPLAAVGATLLPEALKASAPRYTEHGEFQPLSGDLRVFPEYGRRREEERLNRDLTRADAGEAAFLSRQQLAEEQRAALKPYRDATAALAKQKADIKAAAAAEGNTLKGQIYKDFKRIGEDIDSLSTIKEGFSKKFTTGTSRGFTMVGELQDAAARAAPGFVSDEWVKNREAWADLQRLKEMKSRYELFGATLTGNEKTSWQSVTPPRGSTKAQLEEWIAGQEAFIQKAVKHSADAAAAGGWNKRQIEEHTRGLWRAPLTAAEQLELNDLRNLGGPQN